MQDYAARRYDTATKFRMVIQTRQEENSYSVNHALGPMVGFFFVTRMLTHHLLAVANLLVSIYNIHDIVVTDEIVVYVY